MSIDNRALLSSGLLLLAVVAAAAVAAETGTDTPAPTTAAPVAGPALPAPAAPPTPEFSVVDRGHFNVARPEIQAFIEQLAAQGFDRRRVSALLSAAEPQQKILDAMSRPAEKTLQWWEYRARVMTPTRVEAGVELWHEHKELLDQVALEYQVAPEYLVAVIGVETKYGRNTGHFRVIDALMTLAFDYPPRSTYFRKELTQFLLLAREDKLDPLSIRGSYAGAMGALQFMPSSYRRFAVSEQHDAHRDLWGDWGDIFASTANYLHQAGWQHGAPVLAEVQLPGDLTVTPPDRVTLTETLGGLRSHGLSVTSELPDDTPAVLVSAPQQNANGYRVGFQNFYVITRYNNSPLYAMAVYELAQEIRQQIAQEAAL
ncbi:MAG: lytic murein transglycosylase B [Steroidobacteraceae bacterium]